MYTPYSDMPRSITYVGSVGTENLIQFAEEQHLSGLWKRMRKMRPSKWKPKQFVKAAAIVGAGVILGPAAALAAAKGAKAGAGLISRSVKASGPIKVPTSTFMKQAEIAREKATRDAIEFLDSREANAPSGSSGSGITTAGFGGAMPLLLLAGLFLMSKKGR